MNASEAKKISDAAESEKNKEKHQKMAEEEERLKKLAKGTAVWLIEKMPEKVEEAARKGENYASMGIPYEVWHYKEITEAIERFRADGFEAEERVSEACDHGPATAYVYLTW